MKLASAIEARACDPQRWNHPCRALSRPQEWTRPVAYHFSGVVVPLLHSHAPRSLSHLLGVAGPCVHMKQASAIEAWACDPQRWNHPCRALSRPQEWTRPVAYHFSGVVVPLLHSHAPRSLSHLLGVAGPCVHMKLASAIEAWACDPQRWNHPCRALSRPQEWTRPVAYHFSGVAVPLLHSHAPRSLSHLLGVASPCVHLNLASAIEAWACDPQRWNHPCRALSRPQEWTRPVAYHFSGVAVPLLHSHAPRSLSHLLGVPGPCVHLKLASAIEAWACDPQRWNHPCRALSRPQEWTRPVAYHLSAFVVPLLHSHAPRSLSHLLGVARPCVHMKQARVIHRRTPLKRSPRQQPEDVVERVHSLLQVLAELLVLTPGLQKNSPPRFVRPQRRPTAVPHPTSTIIIFTCTFHQGLIQVLNSVISVLSPFHL